MPTHQPHTPEPGPLVAAAHQFARDLVGLGLSREEAGDIMDDAGLTILKAAAAKGVRVTAEEAAHLLGSRLADAPTPGSPLDRLEKATTDEERNAIIRQALEQAPRDDTAD